MHDVVSEYFSIFSGGEAGLATRRGTWPGCSTFISRVTIERIAEDYSDFFASRVSQPLN